MGKSSNDNEVLNGVASNGGYHILEAGTGNGKAINFGEDSFI